MTPEQLNARSIAIRALLEDETIQDAFSSIEADLTAEWKRSRTTDERENCWRALDIMERLKSWMASNASHDLTALRRAK